MRRLLWLAPVLILGSGACADKKKDPFTCERFQQRSERCLRYLLEAVELRVARRVGTGDVEEDEREDQQRKHKVGLARSIRAKGAEKLCEEVQRQTNRVDRKRYTNMKYCFGRRDCQAFARCALGLW